MASIREVKETFETLVSDNNTVINKLEAAALDAQSKRLEIEDDYMEQLSQTVLSFFLPVDSAALKAIGTATAYDFDGQFSVRTKASLEAARDFNSLTADYGGSIKGVKNKIDELSDSLKQTMDNKAGLAKAIEDRDQLLKPVIDFNRRAKEEGNKTLDEGNLAYFDSKSGFSHVMAMVFNSHYRQGRGLIKQFRKLGTTIAATEKQALEDRQAFDMVTDKGDKISQQMTRLGLTYKSVQTISSKIESEDSIISDLSGKAIKMLEDPAVFNKVAASLGDKIPASVIESRAKIEGFRKIERGMHLRANSLRKASGQLEKQLPKLRKAVRRNGSRQVSVDLAKISKTFRATQKSGGHAASEMRKASASIKNYKPSKKIESASGSGGSSTTVHYGLDPLDVYLNMMIYDMLIHDHHHHDVAASVPDAKAVHDIIGGPESGTNDASVGVDASSPDSLGSGIEDSLSADFNGVADVDVGTIDVPDLDVGGSFDGGGFDAGGGFDIGGGFDF